MSDSLTVDAWAPMQFGGDVRTVLESPRAVMPPKLKGSYFVGQEMP